MRINHCNQVKVNQEILFRNWSGKGIRILKSLFWTMSYQRKNYMTLPILHKLSFSTQGIMEVTNLTILEQPQAEWKEHKREKECQVNIFWTGTTLETNDLHCNNHNLESCHNRKQTQTNNSSEQRQTAISNLQRR